jgi:hypothetical protein
MHVLVVLNTRCVNKLVYKFILVILKVLDNKVFTYLTVNLHQIIVVQRKDIARFRLAVTICH